MARMRRHLAGDYSLEIGMAETGRLNQVVQPEPREKRQNLIAELVGGGPLGIRAVPGLPSA